MIIPDTNLLIYAYNSSAPLHSPAKKWWQNTVKGGELIGVPWVVLNAFLRLLTGRQLVERPFTAAELFSVVDGWWLIPSVQLLEPTQRTYELFRDFSVKHSLSGSMLSDAWISAHVAEQDGVLHTNDADFLQFPEIRQVNPLK